jgi:hypothetical protein
MTQIGGDILDLKFGIGRSSTERRKSRQDHDPCASEVVLGSTPQCQLKISVQRRQYRSGQRLRSCSEAHEVVGSYVPDPTGSPGDTATART